MVSCPTNGFHILYFSHAVSGLGEGALEALEQEEQQRRDRAHGSAGSCRNSTQTDPQPGKCKVPGGPGEEPGETAGGGGFGVGTLITGNISPGEAGGERPCRGRGTLREGLEAGGVGIRNQGAGSPPGPSTRPVESGG